MEKKKGLFDSIAPMVVLFAFATMVAGTSLLKDDVLSTAYTMFDYFPKEFGVTPATDFQGAIILGIFISVTQIISLVVATSPVFSKNVRFLSGTIYLTAAFLDAWTDVIHRSNQLNGDVWVSIAVTIGFYTLGSEFSTSLSIAVLSNFWRKAMSDTMFGFAVIEAFFRNVAKEYGSYQRAAKNRESRYLDDRAKEVGDFGNGNNGSNGNRQNNQTGRNYPPDVRSPEEFIPMNRTADGRPIYSNQQNSNRQDNRNDGRNNHNNQNKSPLPPNRNR